MANIAHLMNLTFWGLHLFGIPICIGIFFARRNRGAVIQLSVLLIVICGWLFLQGGAVRILAYSQALPDPQQQADAILFFSTAVYSAIAVNTLANALTRE
ncbi:MAG: hypothetical protein JWR07_4060 [Nevskia sp.]|nr:hypothetical protein [Nevskia sp.]